MVKIGGCCVSAGGAPEVELSLHHFVPGWFTSFCVKQKRNARHRTTGWHRGSAPWLCRARAGPRGGGCAVGPAVLWPRAAAPAAAPDRHPGRPGGVRQLPAEAARHRGARCPVGRPAPPAGTVLFRALCAHLHLSFLSQSKISVFFEWSVFVPLLRKEKKVFKK